MGDVREGSAWAVGAVTLLLVSAYGAGVLLLRSWLFVLATVLAGAVGVGVVAAALAPRRFEAWWETTVPLAAVPPAVLGAGLLAYRLVDVSSPAHLVTAAAVAVGAGVLLALALRSTGAVRRAFGGDGVPLPLCLPAVVAGALAGYLLAAGRFRFLTVAFLIATTLVALQVLVVAPLALIDLRTRASAPSLPDPAPRVSVLVPAYEEADTITRCVGRLLESDYPPDRMEVVVVDDGSTDDTYDLAAQYRDPRVSVFRKGNGGKHSALNYGLLCSRGEVVVTVDADSAVAPDAVSRAVARLLADPRTGAVAGTVSVANRDRAVTKLQALEYVVSINTVRRLFDLFGVVPIVPGCLGAFRRRALESVGGYDPDTVTEDFDLTLHLLKRGWRVRTTDAVVRTEVPFTWRALYDQRKRWSHGTLQSLYKHLDLLGSSEIGAAQRFMYPFKSLSVLAVPLVLPAIVVAALVEPVGHVLALCALFGTFLALLASVAIAAAGEDPRLLLYFPLFLVGYRQLLDATILRGVAASLLRVRTEWVSVPRRSALDDPSDSAGATGSRGVPTDD